MGFLFNPRANFKEVPGINQYLSPVSGFGDQFDLGRADFGQRQAKQIMKGIGEGDYSGIIGTYLNPITDAAKTSEREMERNMSMGANAMYAGTQPALMAGLQQEAKLRGQEQLGMQYAAAIPQLYGQAQQAYGAGRGRQIAEMGLDLQSLIAALEGKISANKLVTGPSVLSQLAQAAAGAGTLAAGL